MKIYAHKFDQIYSLCNSSISYIKIFNLGSKKFIICKNIFSDLVIILYDDIDKLENFCIKMLLTKINVDFDYISIKNLNN